MDSDFSVRLATLEALGGDTSVEYASVYDIDLEILRLTEQGGQGGGIPEAPKDNKTYGRKNGAWSEVSGVSENKVKEIVESYGYETETGAESTYETINNCNSIRGRLDVDEANIQTAYGRLSTIEGAYIKAVSLTQAEYDALVTKDSKTLYVITD